MRRIRAAWRAFCCPPPRAGVEEKIAVVLQLDGREIHRSLMNRRRPDGGDVA